MAARRRIHHAAAANSARIRRLCAIAAVLVAAGRCAVSPGRVDVDPGRRGGGTVRVGVTAAGAARPVTMDLETYVAASLAAELALAALEPATALQLARIQAIVARTYAAANRGRHRDQGFDLCDGTHCQLYRPIDAVPPAVRRIARAAAAATRGQVLLADGRPALALFHADCGGHTTAAGRVWGGAAPAYLAGAPDPFCLIEGRAPWRFTVERARLVAALNADPRTTVGSRLARIEVVERDASGRAVRVVLDGDRAPVVRGEELRAVLAGRFGPRALRSTRFTARRDGEGFVFEGRGYGHGVGLCQAGALARVRAGHSPAAVLEHYFPGVRLSRPAAALPGAVAAVRR